jgi:[ribosomal protein S5]-alanine N-acetyltransferase
MTGTVRLITTRLVLRPFTMEDEKAVHRYASDPAVCRYMVHGPNTPEQTLSFLRMAIAELEKDPCASYHLAIVERETQELIGACSLEIVSGHNLAAELGYCLDSGRWNRGYATECAKALVAFGFQELGLHRIQATCRPANIGSARVLEKAGMLKEGLLRHHKLIRGTWEDSLLYAVIADEWKDDTPAKVEQAPPDGRTWPPAAAVSKTAPHRCSQEDPPCRS